MTRSRLSLPYVVCAALTSASAASTLSTASEVARSHRASVASASESPPAEQHLQPRPGGAPRSMAGRRRH